MATGKCVMYKYGKPYAINVDYDGLVENQIDIEEYEERGSMAGGGGRGLDDHRGRNWTRALAPGLTIKKYK